MTETGKEEEFNKYFSEKDKPYSCDICGRSYNNYSNLKRHSEFHLSDFKCHCGAAFRSKEYLKYHQKGAHEEGFKCNLCPKGVKFKTRTALLSHKNKDHENKYQCEVCGKKCGQRHHLKDHMLTHKTSAPNTQCNQCGITFTHMRSLTRHMKSETCVMARKRGRKPKEAQPEVCEHCGKTFASLRALKQHLQMHDQSPSNKCAGCGQVFKHKQSYVRHKKNMPCKHLPTRTRKSARTATAKQKTKTVSSEPKVVQEWVVIEMPQNNVVAKSDGTIEMGLVSTGVIGTSVPTGFVEGSYIDVNAGNEYDRSPGSFPATSSNSRLVHVSGMQNWMGDGDKDKSDITIIHDLSGDAEKILLENGYTSMTDDSGRTLQLMQGAPGMVHDMSPTSGSVRLVNEQDGGIGMVQDVIESGNVAAGISEHTHPIVLQIGADSQLIQDNVETAVPARSGVIIHGTHGSLPLSSATVMSDTKMDGVRATSRIVHTADSNTNMARHITLTHTGGDHVMTSSSEHVMTSSGEHVMTSSGEHVKTSGSEHVMTSGSEHVMTSGSEHIMTSGSEQVMTSVSEHAIMDQTYDISQGELQVIHEVDVSTENEGNIVECVTDGMTVGSEVVQETVGQVEVHVEEGTSADHSYNRDGLSYMVVEYPRP